jgi:predicted Zn-dependent protease
MQGMELLFLKFSRDNERESDRLGVEYTSKIGYDANEMGNFFNVLHKMQMGNEQAGVPTFLSTHPDPEDRFHAVQRMTKMWQDSLRKSEWAVNSDSYLRMIDGLVYGEDPRQGFVENNVFYHPAMKFKYPVPAGWQLQNSPIQVQMAPADGNALMIFTVAPQKTLEEAGQKTLADLKLTVLDSKNTEVNGFPAIAAISQQVSQNQQTSQQQVIKVMSYMIEYEGSILVFHGISGEENFNSYYQTFESTMSNFDRLTETGKLNVQPEKIKIAKVKSSGTLADAFKSYKVEDSRFKELALLNNLELNDRVEEGRLFKVISK